MFKRINLILLMALVFTINIYNTNALEIDSKYKLESGLNIIAIDLGGPYDSNRENGAFGDATLLEQNGNYLLIDTGTDDENNVLINFLKSQKINKFSIYISHYHNDHYGKVKDILNDSYFNVEKIYFQIQKLYQIN